MVNKKAAWAYRLMSLPAVICMILFSYIPMFGIVIAFQRFVPARGVWNSDFVGLANFQFMFELPEVWRAINNTLIISGGKIILGIIVPVTVAILLNEIRVMIFKRTTQTIIYLPYFLSWVILGIIFRRMLGLHGLINQIMISIFDGERVHFLANGPIMLAVVYITEVWKNFGFGTIIYLAAMVAIDPTLYEAASIDGASRLKRIFNVTLPGIAPVIILMTTLSLGQILNAGFDQIFNLYNSQVFSHLDILCTYIYRQGLVGMQYGLAAAVGLLRSTVGMVMIVGSYLLARKFADYRIF